MSFAHSRTCPMESINHPPGDEPLGFTVGGIVGLAGGAAAVAAATGLTVAAVGQWDRRIPARHARRVAIMAGLPLEIVRPDMVRAGHAQALAECGVARV